jgi:crotonobetainyl-CoA:carnitine CoA-transferase CaiB-like acyl-CoA transferase
MSIPKRRQSVSDGATHTAVPSAVVPASQSGQLGDASSRCHRNGNYVPRSPEPPAGAALDFGRAEHPAGPGRLPSPRDWQRFDLLEGVRVLDLTDGVAGPYATMMLADLGADVANVDAATASMGGTHGGRGAGDRVSLWDLSVHRNKSSVKFDPDDVATATMIDQLITAADVVVASASDEILRPLLPDYAHAAGLRSDIIYCSITGKGTVVPRGWPDALPVPDALDRVRSCPQDATTRHQLLAADLYAGIEAAYAIAAALLHRDRTGQGHWIDIAVEDAATHLRAPSIVATSPPARGRACRTGRGEAFETADATLALDLSDDDAFQRFCIALDRPTWVDVPVFATALSRDFHRSSLWPMIAEVMRTRTAEDWIRRFLACGIIPEPSISVEEETSSASCAERGLFYSVACEGRPAVPQINTGWQLDGGPNGRAALPHPRGADTQRVIREWTLSADRPGADR